MSAERIQFMDDFGTRWSIRHNSSAKPSSPTLLCLHGFTGSGQDFEPLLAFIGYDKINSLCIDLPGHGESDCPEDPDSYSINALVKSLQAIPEVASITGEVILLGYSMGARLALHYLNNFPETRAILISGSPGLKAEQERIDRINADAVWIRKLQDPGYSIYEFASEWESQPVICSQTRLPEPLCSDIAERRRSNDPLGLATAMQAWGTGMLPSLWENLRQLDGQLLIAGEDDMKFCRIAEEMCQINASLKMKMIEGAGHSPHLENPVKTAQVIKDYLLN